jgi:hypothetical protein
MTIFLENKDLIIDYCRINNFSNYFINKNGTVIKVFKKAKNKKMSCRKDRAGYLTVRLTGNGKTVTKFLHRLIAETFIKNPNNYSFVNHINGIKTDNRIENLEWVSHSQNIKHAYTSRLIKNKGKAVFDKCCNKKFVNSKEAAKVYGINHNTLRGYLNGQIKKKTCLEYINK